MLRISLFGFVHIRYDRRPTEIKLSRAAQGLLAYLLLEQRLYSREALASLFWGDSSESQARSCLSTALWRLRRVLEPADTPQGTYIVSTPNGEVGFNWNSSYWLDVAAFERCVREILPKAPVAMTSVEAEQLNEALKLHRADLLEGFYDDWTLRERERLHRLYLDGLAQLLAYYKHRQQYDQGLLCGEQILSHDPLQESIYREMMVMHWQLGQPDKAIRFYRQCCRLLADELNIAPMAETQMLYGQIIAAAGPGHLLADEHMGRLQLALQQLHLARHEFEQAQAKLQQAIHLVEQVSHTPGY